LSAVAPGGGVGAGASLIAFCIYRKRYLIEIEAILWVSVQQESTAGPIMSTQGLFPAALAPKLDLTAAMSMLLEASNYNITQLSTCWIQNSGKTNQARRVEDALHHALAFTKIVKNKL
jgi:hypothetical protein